MFGSCYDVLLLPSIHAMIKNYITAILKCVPNHQLNNGDGRAKKRDTTTTGRRRTKFVTVEE